MFYRLPPAGEPIPQVYAPYSSELSAELFDSFVAKFYGSGTEALSAAIVAALKLKSTPDPEVLIPAYTCPAVVSALLYARAKPVLVDFEKDRPWMDLAQLQSKISARTVAIIAVHLFGIPERLMRIREIAHDANLVLIEDSAQLLPDPDRTDEHGDLVVLSFGRGKPVTLLHGGAVLTTDLQTRAALATPTRSNRSPFPGSLWFGGNALVYNLFRSPYLYWVPASLPFMHLGETRFEPLYAISEMAKAAVCTLPAVLTAHRQGKRKAQDRVARMVASVSHNQLVDLPRVCCNNDIPKLIRYPLLVNNSRTRDSLLHELGAAGLGVSRMYPATLPHIPGLEQILASQGHFPTAEKFSRSLITLPTHSGVRHGDVQAMRCLFQKTLCAETP
jgi:dTDP-4-amino-4,6-dideoxygalactose transaminase